MSFWESFWAVIGWFFWATIFIAYLMALFTVLADIVRDEKLKGWAKAIWIVFLIFVPFLTALVYLVARGDGMSERNSQAVREGKREAEDYIRSVAQTDPATQIEKAARLLESGAISQTEYDQLKSRALAV
ncbi:SHOCT domain-containing protein [Leucobacter weissii]|uniref:SHOCT domain-containing protein n=1 Tax=Leucobacter weissii TaxID=1983706 RepID=A0A939SB18_9MICO|nr:SHOCT domain-containing protein [Leucobacter weissii]MBO1902532.1 SHOCT domain-containing protein [Leucobacter weissii]